MGRRSSPGTLRRLLALYRPSLGWQLLGLVLALITLLANTVLMATSGWFIAAMGLAGVAGATLNYFTPAAIIRACAILRTGGRYAERLVTHDATLRVLSHLRVWCYRRLEPLAPAGLEEERSGALLSRLGRDIDTLDNLYLRILLPLAVAVAASLLFLVWLAWQSPQLALAEGLLLLLGGFLLPALLAGAGHRAGRSEVQLLSALRSDAADGLQGLGELVLYGAEHLRAVRLENHGGQLGQAQLATSRWRNAGQAMVGLSAWLTLWIFMALVMPQVAEGMRPPAELSLLALFALASFEAVTPLPLAFQALAPTLEAGERLFALVDRPPPVPEPSGPAPRPGDHGYRFEQVWYRHPGSERPTLQGLELDIPSGTHTAIVGPSGSGKSTLLQLLVRFRLPDSGRLLFGGTDIRDWPGMALRQRLAVVEQDSHLFIGTVRQNLLLARPDASETQMRSALERAQLGSWLEGLPRGLDTEIGEAAVRLSGGEAKRLAIARALLRDAPVLILDEPTEGLDRPTARRLMDELLEHCRNRTLILVTHQLELLPRMNQVVLLDQGRILARGSHREQQQSSGDYRRLLSLSPLIGS